MAEVGVATRGDPVGRERRNGHRPGAGRRRPLPGGRAVVGGLLVAASAVGLYSASLGAQGGPRESYVVARHPLAPGARLTAADLTRTPIDLPPAVAARAFRDARSLVGATVVAPLEGGELVQASAVVAKPSGPASREVTFPVPRATVGAGLEPGERIDVVATYGTGVDAFSTLVLRQATVVAIDRGRGARVPEGEDIAVTVAVDDPEGAVAMAHALQLGRLTVVRATGAAPIFGAQAVFRHPAPTTPPPPNTAAPGRAAP